MRLKPHRWILQPDCSLLNEENRKCLGNMVSPRLAQSNRLLTNFGFICQNLLIDWQNNREWHDRNCFAQEANPIPGQSAADETTGENWFIQGVLFKPPLSSA